MISKTGIIISIAFVFVIVTKAESEKSSLRTDHFKLCHDWAVNQQLRHQIEVAQQNAHPCPCERHQAKREYTYEQSGNCFTEYFFTDGVKQKCCYDDTGNLLTNYPYGGYLLLEESTMEIKEAHGHCCDGNEATCKLFYNINPSNDCAGYAIPQYRTSGGDVRITTIDNVEYDFNGHGEYVFLKMDVESLLIQIRTEYDVSDNHDATIITAVALKFKDIEKPIEIMLNRTTKSAVLYWNSTYSFHSDSTEIEPSKHNNLMMFPPKGNALTLVYIGSTGRGSLQINIEAGDFLNIRLLTRGDISKAEALGLAGSSVNESIISANGNKYPVNATEYDFFYFGESWTLKQENESLFDYNLTDGNFSVFNEHHTNPRFLEDLVDNLTALFNGSTKNQIDNYNKTCEDHKECLLAIARTGDIHQGEIIMQRIHAEELQREITDNTPPFFTNETKILNVSYDSEGGVALNLSALVSDKEDSIERLKFNISTTINDTDFSLNNGIFNWTYISPALRYMDIDLEIIVTDHLERSTIGFISIIYCGCEKRSQCKYDEVVVTGDHFQRVDCSCKDTWLEGRFCEVHISPCNITTCFANVTCDNDAEDKDNPCGPCPLGYSGDGKTCLDVDECAVGYCKQNCDNTEGSYSCSCLNGYTLSGNSHDCSDIDECHLNTDNCSLYMNTRCRNIPGGFVCDCNPAFHKERNGSGACKEGGFSYVGEIRLVVTDIQLKENDTLLENDKKRIELQLTTLFTGAKDFISVEVVSAYFIITQIRRKKRDVQKELAVEFIVNTETQTNTTALTSELISALKRSDNVTVGKIWSVPIENINFDDALKIIPESKNKLCSVTVNQCDEDSTVCVQKNGRTFCECKKPGFTEYDTDINFCKDIDECKNMTYLGTNTAQDRCYQGKCYNSYGSWECICPDDKILKPTGDHFFRCMNDYQYIGNTSFLITDIFNASKINDTFRQKVDDIFNISTSDIGGNLKMKEVYIKSEVLEVQKHETMFLNKAIHGVSIKYILHIGEPLSWETLAEVQNQSFYNVTWNDWTNLSAYIYNENEYSICDIPGKTDCQAATTICKVRNGTYHCHCKTGYTKTNPMKEQNVKYCSDIDECISNNCTTAAQCCSNHGTCINTVGSWTCDCEEGFIVSINDSNIISCEDIDECALNETFVCRDGVCSNTIGSWNCNCDKGYRKETLGKNVFDCKDIDECHSGQDTYPCNGSVVNPHSAICVNTIGSWSCKCKDGYKQNRTAEEYSCEDIDECQDPTEKFLCRGSVSSINSGFRCNNTDGSWSCVCDAGYTRNTLEEGKKYECIDIDECQDKSYSCEGSVLHPGAASCTNRIGSWSCTCAAGYKQIKIAENRYRCEDMNECQDQTGEYSCRGPMSSITDGVRCENTDGNWSCICDIGYIRKTRLEGKKYVCEDVCDENPCQNNGNCQHGDNKDNFICECTEGWTGKLCDSKDPESKHLKTILIACGSSAAGIIVLLMLAIVGVWRYRSSHRHGKEEKISLSSLRIQNSWPHLNGNICTSPPDSASLQSESSKGLPKKIPRPQIVTQNQDMYLEETIEIRDPAPDYDPRSSSEQRRSSGNLRVPSGDIHPAPDYDHQDPSIMRRKPLEAKVRRGSFDRPAKNRHRHSAQNRHSMPQEHSYL